MSDTQSNNRTAPLAAPLNDYAALDERQARIAWSTVIEPGDLLVSTFIEAHAGDAAAALAAVAAGSLDRVPTIAMYAMEHALPEWKARLVAARVEAAIRATIEHDVTVVIPGDVEWPAKKLERLGVQIPVVLFVRGDAALLNHPSRNVSVTGARASSGYGEHLTMELVAGLVSRDVTVIAGGAYGVDAVAMRAGLAARGRVIAVLAGGVEQLYPAGNSDLLTRVAEAGAIISELPLGTAPTRGRFMARSRIVAALGDALVVPEAGRRSGSLITVGHANQLGIPVGAVPGPVTSPTSTGTHDLIRTGTATLVTGVDDVMALLPPLPTDVL